MLLSTNYQNIPFKGIVPLKNYKGPLLKLSDDDKRRIEQLQETVGLLEHELYRLQRYYSVHKMTSPEKDRYFNRCMVIESEIEDLLNEIKNIKINRLNMQKKYDI